MGIRAKRRWFTGLFPKDEQNLGNSLISYEIETND